MKIDLHIERLVVDDLPLAAGEGAPFTAALERELALLLRGGLHPALAGGIAVPRVATPPMSVTPGAKPSDLGAAAARAIHGGIGGKR